MVAGIVASFACGLGALPLLIPQLDPKRHTGLGYAAAGGLMFAASVFNLIAPGIDLTDEGPSMRTVLPVMLGILLGAGFIAMTNRYLARQRLGGKLTTRWGGRTGVLILLAMTIHSIPEGVAVGTAFVSSEIHGGQLGWYVATAIALHNIPEGLAVAIPMRSGGASISRCFWAAFLSSLPQPIAAVPAIMAAWLFEPLMPVLMGFAAGAMIFLIVMELLPDAMATIKPTAMAWAFILGFCSMLLVQIML